MATSRRVGNYATSAKAVVGASEQIFDAAMSGKPDFTAIAKESIKGRSLARRTVEKKKGQVANAFVNATSGVKRAQIRGETEVKLAEKKKPSRMAGVVGALSSLAGGYVLGKERRDNKAAADAREAADLARDQKLMDAFNNRGGVKSTPYEVIPEFDASQFVELNTEPFTLGGSNKSTTAPQSTSTKNVQSLSVKPGAFQGDMSSYTDEMKKNIGYIVSGEAARGTDDIYAVAGVVMNRMESPDYPSSAYDVGHQKGQFEAVEKGMARHEPELVNKLFSEEGMKKIQAARKTLAGRDSFKGQALLKNRVAAEDPMFHPSGNFYHYSHQ